MQARDIILFLFKIFGYIRRLSGCIIKQSTHVPIVLLSEDSYRNLYYLPLLSLHMFPLFLHLRLFPLSLLFLLSFRFMFVGEIRMSLSFHHLHQFSSLYHFPHPPRCLQIRLLLSLPRILIFPLPFIRVSALALIILSLTLFLLIICLLLKHFLYQYHHLLFLSPIGKPFLILVGVRQWNRKCML